MLPQNIERIRWNLQCVDQVCSGTGYGETCSDDPSNIKSRRADIWQVIQTTDVFSQKKLRNISRMPEQNVLGAKRYVLDHHVLIPFEHCVGWKPFVIHFDDHFPIDLDSRLFAALLMGFALSTLLL
jgi:hypothetical protein